MQNNFEDIPKIPAKPDGGSCAKAEFGNDLIPRVEDLAEPHRVKPFRFVVRDFFLFDLRVQRKQLKAFTWKDVGLARR